MDLEEKEVTSWRSSVSALSVRELAFERERDNDEGYCPPKGRESLGLEFAIEPLGNDLGVR
jgi:hypothetical protein